MKYLMTEEWKEISNCLDGEFIYWLFIKAEIFFNLYKGSSKKEIFDFFDEIHEFITKISIKLRLSQLCISQSMTIFHKFYIQNITFMSEIEKLLYAIVCLFIGSKICNELLPLEKIIQEYLLCIMKKSEITKEAIIETTQKVCSVEFEVLAKIGFSKLNW